MRHHRLIPGRWQNAAEYLVEFLIGLISTVVGGDRTKAKKFFPLVATFFLFILVANMLDVIPGVDTVGAIDTKAVAAAHGQPVLGFLLFGNISNAVVPWIRPATSDLNLTIGMAIIAVITAQGFGFATLGAGKQIGKFINFHGPIDFVVGLLELVGEFSRIISLAFRLFGNIFAGTIVLSAFAFLLPVVGDIIFIPFELFVAVLQAFIFALLSLLYLQLATESHEHAEEEFHSAEAADAANRERAATAH
jgi:F-type H+-transporting ATPase subunit a